MIFNSRLIIFTTIIASFFGCKHQKTEITNISEQKEDTIKILQDDTAVSNIEILKSVIIPKEKNNLVDSVVVFGSDNNEYSIKYIDSIFVYFVSGKIQLLYKRNIYPDETDIYWRYGDVPHMDYEIEKECFTHFNNDQFSDIYFTNLNGGSGGRTYNVFNYNKNSQLFNFDSLLSDFPNIHFVKDGNQYLSLCKSGSGFTAARRFIISQNKIKDLILFTSSFNPGKLYDTLVYNYTTYSRLGRTKECYILLDDKSKTIKTTCNKAMINLQKQIWKDWELHQ